MENTDASNRSKIVVLCDFDGTITTVNVLNTLYAKFSSSDFMKLIDLWEKSKISTREEIEGSFATVTASKSEMENVLVDIDIDPGFISLYRYCQERDFHFAIVSDGLKWYIEYLLSRHNLFNIEIFANEILFSEDGIRFEFPWYDESTPLRGTSKSTIVWNFQSRGYKVVYIGDGQSDIEGAIQSDFVFARDYLFDHLRRAEIEAFEFTCLKEIEMTLRSMV